MKRYTAIIAASVSAVLIGYFALAAALFFVPDQYMPPTNWPFNEGSRKAYKPFSGPVYVITP